jgi:uncharacterized membrane protein YesL
MREKTFFKSILFGGIVGFICIILSLSYIWLPQFMEPGPKPGAATVLAFLFVVVIFATLSSTFGSFLSFFLFKYKIPNS